MTLYAQIRRGAIRLIQDRTEIPTGQHWVDISSVTPTPLVGYLYVNGQFVAPPEKIYIIEARQLWGQMTDTEQDALLDSVNAQVVKLVRRMKDIGFIRGTKAQITTVAQGLVTLGIFSSIERAKEVFLVAVY